MQDWATRTLSYALPDVATNRVGGEVGHHRRHLHPVHVLAVWSGGTQRLVLRRRGFRWTARRVVCEDGWVDAAWQPRMHS